MKTFKPVRGMRDFLAEGTNLMKFIENKARKIAKIYGYKEVITPVVESYELLAAKIGEEMRSRMFVFKDLGGRDIALRPEFTASVARLVATTLKTEPKPIRIFSFGSVYRYDEPQKGRYREFWQSNYELMGSNRPEADFEILMLTDDLMASIGLKNYVFKIGHIGVLKGIFNKEGLQEKTQNAIMQLMDKKQYEEALKALEDAGASKNCVDTIQELVKLKGKEVFSILEKMRKILKEYEKSAEAVENLQEILRLVKESECKMDVIVDAGFARGLEYYTGIIFEAYVPEFDIALGGGGRYDNLIELFGGEPTPAVGVAHGIDRIMLAMQMQKATPKEKERAVMIIPVEERLRGETLKISQMLRTAGIPVEVEVMGRKVTKALEDADRRRIGHAIIVGDKELKEGAVVLRDLRRREQKTVKVENLVDELKKST
ncbi:MAG: histidine--tRNA ligase [Candidatus Bathycorpusculaceae bacterium]